MHVKSFQLFSFENFHVIWRLQFHVENIFSKINMIDMISYVEVNDDIQKTKPLFADT